MNERGESVELFLPDGTSGAPAALRAEFSWCGDRFGHRLTWVEAGRERTLLESIEGRSEDRWPPSPALQQLSFHGSGTDRVALLVGMAGKSHYSLSVEPCPAERGIVFDVACRLNEPAELLVSSYLAAGFESPAPGTAVRAFGSTRCTVTLDSSLPPSSQSLNLKQQQLSIGPLAGRSSGRETARWKYRLTIA